MGRRPGSRAASGAVSGEPAQALGQRMTEEKLERFRSKLEVLRGELLSALGQDDGQTAPVAPDRAIGRLTRQDAMLAQQMALELRRRNQTRLAQIESALKRIEDGSYGLCRGCEEEISEPRLEARPEAHLCLHCAERPRGRAPY